MKVLRLNPYLLYWVLLYCSISTLLLSCSSENECFTDTIIGSYEGTLSCQDMTDQTIKFEIFSPDDISFNFATKFPSEDYTLQLDENIYSYSLNDKKILVGTDTATINLSVTRNENSTSYTINGDFLLNPSATKCEISASRTTPRKDNDDSYDLSLATSFDTPPACICDQGLVGKDFTLFTNSDYPYMQTTRLSQNFSTLSSSKRKFFGNQGFYACWSDEKNGLKASVGSENGLSIFSFDTLSNFIDERHFPSSDLFVHDMLKTGDNEYLIAGKSKEEIITESDVFIAKILNNELLWLEIFDFAERDFFGGITLSKSGHIVLSSVQVEQNIAKLRLSEVDIESGRILNSRVFEELYSGIGPGSSGDILTLDDGSFIILSVRNTSLLGHDFQIMRTTPNGDIIWHKHFEWEGLDFMRNLKIDKDNNLIIGGSTSSFGRGDLDWFLIKMNLDGNLIWKKTYGNKESNQIQDIAILEDGSYLISGSNHVWNSVRNRLLLKVDINGIPIPK